MLNKNVLKNVYIYAWYIAPHNKTGLRVLPLSALSPKKRTLEKNEIKRKENITNAGMQEWSLYPLPCARLTN